MTITTGALLAPPGGSFAEPAPAPAMAVAPIGRRVAAFAVDLAVTALVVAGVYVATDEYLYAVLALVEVPVALCVWEARSGLTVGNALLRVRTVRADGPFAPGIGRSAVRGLVVLAGFLVAAVGQWAVVASGAWDRSPLKQGWHDALARTTMIDVSRRSRARTARTSASLGHLEPTPGPLPSFREPVLSTPDGVTRRTDVAPAVAPPAPDLVAPPAPAPLLPAAPPLPAAPALPTVPGPAPAPAPPAGAYGVEAPGVPAFTQALPSWSPPRPPDAPAGPREPDPAPTAAPRRAAAVGFLLSFDNGQSFTVHGSGLVGRKPQSAPGERHDDLLAVDDENRSLSKTHLEFGIDAGGFWVTDRGSTNGTSVLTAHGEPLDVHVGVRVHVPGDGSVRVGQRQFTARPLTR